MFKKASFRFERCDISERVFPLHVCHSPGRFVRIVLASSDAVSYVIVKRHDRLFFCRRKFDKHCCGWALWSEPLTRNKRKMNHFVSEFVDSFCTINGTGLGVTRDLTATKPAQTIPKLVNFSYCLRTRDVISWFVFAVEQAKRSVAKTPGVFLKDFLFLFLFQVVVQIKILPSSLLHND